MNHQNTMPSVTGLILAGGQARRMGGRDKGLLEWQGQMLISHVIHRLKPQVSRLCINANRHLEVYQQWGLPVFSDSLSGFQGPLAGILTGLQQLDTDYLLVVPCDAPLLPHNLGEQLWQCLQAQAALLAMVHDGQRMQPTFALLHKDLQDSLAAYLASGERRLQVWMQQQQAAIADFSSQTQAFINLNTPQDWQGLDAFVE